MHVDYVSMVVHNFPATQCAAYVQKCCTCEVQLCDHITTSNSYKSVAPWNTLESFTHSNDPSSSVNAIGLSNDGMNSPLMPSSMFFSSNTTEETLNLVSPTHASSPYISSCAFSSSRDVGNTCSHFIPTPISSPLGGSASSGTQLDIMHTPTFSANDSFIHYANNFGNNTYVCQPGDSMDESSEYQGHLNATYDTTRETWLYPYA
ncbi:hypothetical protein EV421DRAFT_1838303 [Armillaria borealis]|uniref:Uncharacterized protein n=1 Tax=Armillaria borealis TaxID=47425 RepID=A0AA39J520_9AGAR|nr:hypothetical protein EV421DRAFT_1838303 [Armillaria borealis]